MTPRLQIMIAVLVLTAKFVAACSTDGENSTPSLSPEDSVGLIAIERQSQVDSGGPERESEDGDEEDEPGERTPLPAPEWGPDATYKQEDLDKAVRRVHFGLYCMQWTVDAVTTVDGGRILSRVVGRPANGEVMSIEDFQSNAEHLLLSGANKGISIVVEEWKDGPTTSPEDREVACDDYVHSRTPEELEEADLRFYARQQGMSYDEMLWEIGWHDDFDRQVVARIEREHPGAYVQMAYGTMRGNKRSARIGFYGDINEGIQQILDEYSEANEVVIETRSNLGFYGRDMEQAVSLVYNFLMDSEGVAGGFGGSDWDRVSITVELESGIPESRVDELREEAQRLIYENFGEDTGITVDVVIGQPGVLIRE